MKILGNTALVTGGILVLGIAAGFSFMPVEGLSSQESLLAPCPDSPNCVSSLAPGGPRHVAPLSYASSRDAAIQTLVDLLEAEPSVRIVSRQADYLHAEFSSRLFKFVDDVTFYFPADAPVIHVRSASRIGYYDFGANRRRVEHLRRLLSSTASP